MYSYSFTLKWFWSLFVLRVKCNYDFNNAGGAPPPLPSARPLSKRLPSPPCVCVCVCVQLGIVPDSSSIEMSPALNILHFRT